MEMLLSVFLLAFISSMTVMEAQESSKCSGILLLCCAGHGGFVNMKSVPVRMHVTDFMLSGQYITAR